MFSFRRKTVITVLSSFNKIVNDLKTINTRQLLLATKAQRAIDRFQIRKNMSEKEAAHAITVAAKIEALISSDTNKDEVNDTTDTQ